MDLMEDEIESKSAMPQADNKSTKIATPEEIYKQFDFTTSLEAFNEA